MIFNIVLVCYLDDMRKIFKENLASFREKDLKQYSKIVNQYFKRKCRFVFLFLIFLTSCSVQNQINKEEFKRVPKTMSVRFYDKLDTIRYGECENNFFTTSFIKNLTNKENIDYSKSIEVKVIDNQLYIKFYDNLDKFNVLKFYGKRYRKRYVFYINYETISFPFLFISKQMTKYTIEIPDYNSILFKRNYSNEGMLLIFGAGNSSEKEYIFKTIRYE